MKIKLSEIQTGEMKTYLRQKIEDIWALSKSKNNQPEISIDTNIRSVYRLTLGEIVEHFGTKQQFADWIKQAKELEEVHIKRLKSAVTEGKLVSRQLVKDGVFDPIDTCFRKLLTDGAKTIARRLHTMVEAGGSVDASEKYVRDQMTSHIRVMKAKVKRTLKNA